MYSRQYLKDEKPRLGDIVQVFEGAFGCGVITRIDATSVIVERAHMSCSTSGRTDIGQVQIGIERIDYPNKRESWPRPFVDDGNPYLDNRAR